MDYIRGEEFPSCSNVLDQAIFFNDFGHTVCLCQNDMYRSEKSLQCYENNRSKGKCPDEESLQLSEGWLRCMPGAANEALEPLSVFFQSARCKGDQQFDKRLKVCVSKSRKSRATGPGFRSIYGRNG